jgi:hypothetical protein
LKRLLVLIVCLTGIAGAQDFNSISLTSSSQTTKFHPIVVSTSASAERAAPLGFRQFIRQPRTAMQLTFMAGAMTADAITTQRFLLRRAEYGAYEANPLARPLVEHGAWGQAVASGIGFAAFTGGAYLLARHGHPKWSRALLGGMTLGSAFSAVRNSRKY